jgi:hypothetical protein
MLVFFPIFKTMSGPYVEAARYREIMRELEYLSADSQSIANETTDKETWKIFQEIRSMIDQVVDWSTLTVPKPVQFVQAVPQF